MLKASLLLCFLSLPALANDYLTPEDQPYYKNDTRDGNNQRERLDSIVKEINKVHGDVNALKTEIALLKKEIEELKKKK